MSFETAFYEKTLKVLKQYDIVKPKQIIKTLQKELAKRVPDMGTRETILIGFAYFVEGVETAIPPDTYLRLLHELPQVGECVVKEYLLHRQVANNVEFDFRERVIAIFDSEFSELKFSWSRLETKLKIMYS